MFKSIHCNKSLWTIIGDNFEEADTYHEYSWQAIAAVYEKRNLNVAANLIKYFKSVAKNGWSIEKQIGNLLIRDVLLYNKYKNELEKYLLLL